MVTIELSDNQAKWVLQLLQNEMIDIENHYGDADFVDMCREVEDIFFDSMADVYCDKSEEPYPLGTIVKVHKDLPYNRAYPEHMLEEGQITRIKYPHHPGDVYQYAVSFPDPLWSGTFYLTKEMFDWVSDPPDDYVLPPAPKLPIPNNTQVILFPYFPSNSDIDRNGKPAIIKRSYLGLDDRTMYEVEVCKDGHKYTMNLKRHEFVVAGPEEGVIQ